MPDKQLDHQIPNDLFFIPRLQDFSLSTRDLMWHTDSKPLVLYQDTKIGETVGDSFQQSMVSTLKQLASSSPSLARDYLKPVLHLSSCLNFILHCESFLFFLSTRTKINTTMSRLIDKLPTPKQVLPKKLIVLSRSRYAKRYLHCPLSPCYRGLQDGRHLSRYIRRDLPTQNIESGHFRYIRHSKFWDTVHITCMRLSMAA